MNTYKITLLNQFTSVTYSESVEASTVQQAVDVVKECVSEPQEWLILEALVV